MSSAARSGVPVARRATGSQVVVLPRRTRLGGRALDRLLLFPAHRGRRLPRIPLGGARNPGHDRRAFEKERHARAAGRGARRLARTQFIVLLLVLRSSSPTISRRRTSSTAATGDRARHGASPAHRTIAVVYASSSSGDSPCWPSGESRRFSVPMPTRSPGTPSRRYRALAARPVAALVLSTAILPFLVASGMAHRRPR